MEAEPQLLSTASYDDNVQTPISEYHLLGNKQVSVGIMVLSVGTAWGKSEFKATHSPEIEG